MLQEEEVISNYLIDKTRENKNQEVIENFICEFLKIKKPIDLKEMKEKFESYMNLIISKNIFNRDQN